MPSRRRYVTVLTALTTGLAGCLGGDGPSAGDADSPTDTDRPSAADKSSDADETAPRTAFDDTDAAPGFEPAVVAVYDSAVRYSYRRVSNVDWNAVETATGQFLFVGVDARATEEAPPPSTLTLAADGETYAPLDFAAGPPFEPPVGGRWYAPAADSEPTARGWLCFDTAAELRGPLELRVDHRGVAQAWDVPKPPGVSSPPPAWEFEVAAPDSVPPDETFDIEIRAENVGDGDGVFRGAVNFSFPMYRPERFSILSAAGESGTTTVEAMTDGAESGTTLDYGIVTSAGDDEVRVEVE